MRNKSMSNGAAMLYENTSADSIPGGAVVILDEGGTPFCGIATGDMAPGDTGLVDTVGVYSLPKDNTGLTAHKAAYWDKTKGQVSATGVYLGRVWEGAGVDAPAILVRINFGPVPALASA